MPHVDSHAGLAAAERLRRLVPTLAEGDPDAKWLASALARYLGSAPAGLDLDTAVGLATPPGGSPWWRAEAEAERDRLLRELAGPGPGRVLPRAQMVQRLLRRYAATSWPRDRASKSPSAPNELLYRIFCLDPDPPTGISRLREIIGQ
jgi:hypothetical protein